MATCQPTVRRAYTLTELLIVIMIAMLLMVVSLPMIKTVMDDARPREASRVLNTVFFTAKAQAAVTNRLAGVEFIAQAVGDPGANPVAYQCTQMYLCEVPPLYAGDLSTSVATVDEDSRMMDPLWPSLWLTDNTITSDPPNVSSDNTAQNAYSLVNNVENLFEIRFNYRGIWYAARRGSMPNTFQINLPNGLRVPACATSYFESNRYNCTSFQIRRPPERTGNPIELPKATAIDLTYSGYGPLSTMAYNQMTRSPPAGMEFAPALGLRIMFAPEGNVYNVTMASRNNMGQLINTRTAPQGTIHFLVGLPNKVSTLHETGITGPYNAFDITRSNLADPNSLWVSVGRTSGVVTTNENAPDPAGISDPNNATLRSQYFQRCRLYATSREQKGGR